MDYRKTLNITLNDKDPGAFPQRGSLPTREPEMQRHWEEIELYRKSLEKPAPRGSFVLHDGPPYSNGDIHLGTALNKIVKDIVTRSRTMQGYFSPYVPGWDNHGMPIENAVAKKFREEKKTPSRVELRRACREYAAHWIEIQKAEFRRLGVRGNWDKPYLTMNYPFEAKIVEVFGELAEKGYIYRGLKPVLWCGTCETALADAEVEYEPHVSNSIYVRFPLQSDPKGLLSGAENAYAVIWTTTPWTIPANLAIAAHPDAEYALVRLADPKAGGAPVSYLVAVSLREAFLKLLGVTEYETLQTIRGADLEGLVFQHPLFERASPIVLADYVTMDTGTGLVHTAPGHGKEDFDTGQKYGLEPLNPVDSAARYTAAAGEYNGVKFEGLRVTTYGHSDKDAEANVVLLQALESSGNLLLASKVEHSYPHCWRCHSPLIFRATIQWFMNIDHDGFREKAVAAISDVRWYPQESINRITNMVAGRPDWCISRQRSWGVGIPAFYCGDCGEPILKPESVGAVVELIKERGSDAWYEATPEEILPAGFTCPDCGAGADKLRKETDVLDVWFDSGSTNRAVLEGEWPELSSPADLYLEGGDQHRGWFNSSLMISMATRGRPPYRSVVTHGWTLDENGEAMHKSKGNAINPMNVIEQYGADVLRCWAASQDFMEDTSCGDNVLKQVSDSYRRLRNTFRFLINNLYDFDPATDAVPISEMQELDRWILAKLDAICITAAGHYNSFEFHRVFHAVHNFCSVELSAFYLDVLKDRIYASGKTWPERRSAQTAMHRIAETLARLLAPILVHTSEEAWSYLKLPNKPESVHLAALPEPESVDTALIARWEPLLQMRETVKKALEEARKAGTISNALEGQLILKADAATLETLRPFEAQLPGLFLVSGVTLEEGGTAGSPEVQVTRSEGVKCVRCWLYLFDVGSDPAHPELCGRCAKAVG